MLNKSKQTLVESGVSVTEGTPGQVPTLDANSGGSGSNTRSPKADDASKPSSSGVDTKYESHTILLNLPQPKLRLLCSLLARESYYEGCDQEYGFSVNVKQASHTTHTNTH